MNLFLVGHFNAHFATECVNAENPLFNKEVHVCKVFPEDKPEEFGILMFEYCDLHC